MRRIARLDRAAREADSLACAPARSRAPLPLIFGVATALGFFSAFQAYYFVATFTEKPAPFSLLLFLNLGYWYSVGVLRRPSSGCRGASRSSGSVARSMPVHVAGVFAATLLHVALAVRSRIAIRWALGDVGGALAHAAAADVLPELRLGDDDLLGHRRSQPRAPLSPRGAGRATLRAAQLETRLVEAQLQALQRQLQPHFLFNTLNTISALMHRDVEAADGMIARLSDLLRMSLDRSACRRCRSRRSSTSSRSTWRSNKRASGTVSPCVFDVEPDDARRAGAEPPPAAARRKRHQARHRPAARAGARSRSRRGASGDTAGAGGRDDGVGMSAARLSDFNRGVGLSNTRARLEHLYGARHRFEFRQPAEGGLAVLDRHPVRRRGWHDGSRRATCRAVEGVA